MISWVKPSIISANHPLLPWIHLQNVIIPTMITILSTMATVVTNSSIQGELAIDGSLMQWITTLYLLGANTAVPIGNWFADKYGYKRMYFIAICIFLLGTLFSALAFNFWSLAFARFMEGLGAGFIFPIGLAIITHAFPKEKLGFAVITYIAIAFGGGLVLGSLLSGYFGMYLSWRATFWFCVPNIIIALLLVVLFQNETESKHNLKFDFLGFLCFISFIAFLLIALSNGNLKSTDGGWRSPFIIGCFVFSFLGLIATIFIETHVEHPIIPVVLFKDPLFSVGCLTLFVNGMAIFSSISFMVNYMLDGLQYDKFRAGLVGISYGISLGFFSAVASILMQKISATILSLFGLAIIVCSYFFNDILSFQSGKVAITLILVIRAMGIAFILGPVTAQSLRNIPQELAGAGATMLTFFRQVGATYGGAVLSILVIRRQIFHDQRFAEPVNAQLPGYQYNIRELSTHIMESAGSAPKEAEAQAKAVVISNIKIQSFIQAINDAFIFFAYITIAVGVLLVILNVRHYVKRSSP